MINVIIGFIPVLILYGIIIHKVDSGRCFRFEFIIKKLIIYSILFLFFVLINIKSYFLVFFIPYFIIFLVLDIKYTIQRLYDLNVSGWYILLLSIPVINILTTLALFFSKGNCEINEYDKAIKYSKYFKDKRCINIYEKMFIIDNEEYQYERYLSKYIIKISEYTNNMFTDYLYKNYHFKKEGIYKIIEITRDEFENIIKNLELIVINESFYVNINKIKLFIRKENFKYTIIINKNNISNEAVENFKFPGILFEDENYIYYSKVNKKELLECVKYVT